MTTNPKIADEVRRAIISQPDCILDDKDVMHALIAANEKTMGANIVDLRGIAMERLEGRLDRLEDTHRSVISAAYENLAGMNQIHRAVLRLLDPDDLEGLLRDLRAEVADILRLDAMRLVLEGHSDSAVPAQDAVFCLKPEGYVEAYLMRGRPGQGRQVTLRQISQGDADLFGDEGDALRSEACLRLDLGSKRLPGLLVMGAKDPLMFGPQQGTDLLAFFGGVFERTLRRFLP